MARNSRYSNDREETKGGAKTLLWVIIGLLVAGLLAVGVFLFISIEENNRIMENTHALVGVKIGGADISGMSADAAKESAKKVSEEMLGKISISFTVEGKAFTYAAKDLGISTDYEDAVKKAMLYGNTGTLDERKAAIKAAKETGMDFPIKPVAKRDAIAAVILPLKATLDTVPQDATYTFSAWGFKLDGTPYVENEDNMIKGTAAGKMWAREELIRIPADQMPNKLRYLYWQNKKYIPDYIPADASIARFQYKDGVPGRSVNLESVVDSIMAQVQSGSFTPINAPVAPVDPTVKTEDLKKYTQLVSSWTSSYSNHYGYNRNWNVAKLSGIINGVIIQPGQEWSINAEAGNRTLGSGWKEAAGIVNGGYVPQAGGGVCQISSTVYNAAIRTNLNITDSTHHSISSDYIPLGLDATISSGAPDLKLKNDFAYPIYIISYTNPAEKNVTVEMYGPTVVDPTHGDVILNFSFKDGGKYGGDPVMTYVYGKEQDPEGNPIVPGTPYVYAQMRPGRKVETFVHTLSLDGTELKKESFHNYTWKPINGITWVYGTEPTPTPSTTPPPTPTP